MTNNEQSIIYPTVTSIMEHPNPDIRERWLKKYGKPSFTFTEGLYAQSFPMDWIFPPQKTKRWKWLAEAFPPRVAQFLFETYVEGSNLVLLDLFSGIGGWSLGGFWSRKFKKIIMVEKDKDKCRYLHLNFDRLDIEYEVICMDVRKIGPMNIDVISASPPCEDLTILRHLSGSNPNKGTIPLTMFTIQYVKQTKPKIAFYENVYHETLVEILTKHGWIVEKFDMSKIIPQHRKRLIGIYYSSKQTTIDFYTTMR